MNKNILYRIKSKAGANILLHRIKSEMGPNIPRIPIAILIASLCFMVITSDKSISTVFNISSGFFSGIVLWFFVVYFPELSKRRMLKSNLSRAYREFKRNLIAIFLQGVEGADSHLADELMDYREFQRFFGENENKRWNQVANWLDENEDRVGEIQAEMERLSREADYVRSNVSIQDENIHGFLHRLSNMSHYYANRSSGNNQDYMKSLLYFLWSVFAQWDHMYGQLEKDLIQEMIDGI